MPRLLTKGKTEQTSFARQLRKAGNPAEKLLWSKLRQKQFFGLKFRKQVPIGPYTVDFLCIQRKFVIEIDGDSHYEEGRHTHDQQRDQFLRKRGLRILRIGHRETLQNTDSVIERIKLFLGLEQP